MPGKNIRTLNGIPLIAYSIKMAERFLNKMGTGIIQLSTDSEDIKEIAALYGLDTTYTRPKTLAGDETGKVDVMAAALEYAEATHGCSFEYLLDLDISSPLRTLSDLVEAFALLEKEKKALDIFSVNRAGRNPYFNMVELKESGYFGLVKELPARLNTRQSAPVVYDMNASFYIFRRDFFEQGLRSVITESSIIYAMNHICFDIDDLDDFRTMECLIENNIIKVDY